MAKGHICYLMAGSRAIRGKVPLTALPNWLHCCVILIVYTQFRTVSINTTWRAAGRKPMDSKLTYFHGRNVCHYFHTTFLFTRCVETRVVCLLNVSCAFNSSELRVTAIES